MGAPETRLWPRGVAGPVILGAGDGGGVGTGGGSAKVERVG